MSIDSIGSNGINTSNYSNINDRKKVENKNEESSNTSKGIGTDTFIESKEQDTTNSTYKPVKKKLTLEEVKAIKEEQQNLKADLIKRFISDTISNQNKLLGKSTGSNINEMPKETTDLLTKIFGSVEDAYPPLATTQEGAQQAISEGGAYSVTAVADRIMTMAKAIAGDDPDKIQKMRDEVEKGFAQAGLDFSKATKSDLPQISKDTYTEVMKRFDELQDK
ncbi:hypothetical protein [Clostridium vincentii]|uniref:DUF5610 domain-containing protein n=1 Tax=Clostridium vincentii TaxID=52704 RepID=A0A2T0BCK2_9CLOT|nr:hypothetical protein [Clostridium vincentii]PRR81614.1 hypothetical protein CLVI_23390 [Clostridium vincentii]